MSSAEALQESEWPQRIKGKRSRRPKDFDAKLDAMMGKRTQVAEGLEIDPSLIAPRAALETLAGGLGEASDLLLNWQRDLLDLE